jgi:LDH2 family malate/lactate/ureidoglycolate dehydrogenase
MKILPREPLERLMTAAFLRRGLPAEHAGFVVDGMVLTSLRGIDTHGVRLFPVYLRELDGGRAKPRPDLRFRGATAAARLLAADHALGPVAGRLACREAVRLAKASGVGAVAVRDSNYFGGSAQYTLEMAEADTIGLAFTNSDALVAPVGGSRPLFGTNPISFAARGPGDEVFCVDMATSQSSFTKVKQYRESGRALEPGWAVGPDGRDASEPGVEEVAALLPLGGPKGQCLAMMVEILCCLLADMPLDHELTNLYDEPWDRPRVTSHFFLALDVAAFQEVSTFRRRLGELLGLVRSQDGTGRGRVVAPGDFEHESAARRREEGIPLAEEDLERFREIDAEAPPGERVGI